MLRYQCVYFMLTEVFGEHIIIGPVKRKVKHVTSRRSVRHSDNVVGFLSDRALLLLLARLFGQLPFQSVTLLRQSLAEECFVPIIPRAKTFSIARTEILLDIIPLQL